MQEDVILAKIEAISDRQSDVIDSIGRIDDRLIDLNNTVINHINSDISNSNKKSISKTPHWMILLLAFFIGRVSIEAIDIYDKSNSTSSKIEMVRPIAEQNSTYVENKQPKKSLNKRIDNKIINNFLGE